MRSTVQYLVDRFGNFKAIHAKQQLEFYLDKQHQFLEVVPFQDGLGLDWLIVVVTPEADFMQQINANTRNTMLLGLGTVGLAIILGIFTSRWVTRPMLKVSVAAKSLAQGNLDQHVEPNAITEVDTLADSFNEMAAQLKQSFETLEVKNAELRLAEENFRSIFENAVEGIFQSTPAGQYINVNPALARIYGYDSPAEVLASITNIEEQIYVDPEKRTEFVTRLESQGFINDFEYRCYCKDGSIIWTQIDARLVKDSQGHILYYEGMVQDITERKRREEDLRRQLEELQIEIDQAKREKEVALLTESSYFQEVQQEMAEVNLDEFWS